MRMEVVVGGAECVMEMEIEMDELGIEVGTDELMHAGTWDCACVVREVLAGGVGGCLDLACGSGLVGSQRPWIDTIVGMNEHEWGCTVERCE